MAFSSYNPMGVYNADGVRTDFDVPDLFYEIEDVRVVTINDGVESNATLGVDYTVLVIGRELTPPFRQEGYVRFVVPPTAPKKVVTFILPSAIQDQPFEGRSVTPRQQERVHDRHVMRSAMLFEFFNRSYRSTLDTPPGLRTIVAGSQGHVPVWDENGNLIEGPTVGDVDQVAAISAEIVALSGIITEISAISENIVEVAAVAGSLPILIDTAAVLNAVVRFDVPQSLTEPQKAQARANIDAGTGGAATGVPVGMVMAYAAATAPTGWSECDGTTLSRVTEAALFAVIGTTYGAGNGSTTFNKPDLRGEFIRGWDHGRGVDTGRAIGTAQGSQNLAHTHTGTAAAAGAHGHTGTTSFAGSHSHTGSAAAAGAHAHTAPVYQTASSGDASDRFAVAGPFTAQTGTASTNAVTDHSHSLSISTAADHQHTLTINAVTDHTHTLTINSQGGTEARPRNVSMMYCIKL